MNILIEESSDTIPTQLLTNFLADRHNLKQPEKHIYV